MINIYEHYDWVISLTLFLYDQYRYEHYNLTKFVILVVSLIKLGNKVS